jgi:DNA-binding CsgD family transcriptional regulator
MRCSEPAELPGVPAGARPAASVDAETNTGLAHGMLSCRGLRGRPGGGRRAPWPSDRCVAARAHSPKGPSRLPPRGREATAGEVSWHTIARALDSGPALVGGVFHSGGAGGTESLTAAEMRVLRLLPDSRYPRIAATLYISRNTVKTHFRSTYQKLDVTSRSQAIERASRHTAAMTVREAAPRRIKPPGLRRPDSRPSAS